jgi:two-component system, NarL family, response regulator LiaR
MASARDLIVIMRSVLIADDSPLMRRAIRAQLERAGIETISEATDGFEAIAKVLTVHPDLVILDIAMLRLNGLDTIKELRKLRPNLPVILHTQYADAVRSLGPLKGVTEVVAKGTPLIPIVLALIGPGGLNAPSTAEGDSYPQT